VDKNTRITELGKFHDEREALRQAYEQDCSGGGQDSFGQAEDWGYYFHSYSEDGEPVYGRVDGQGFVYEISETEYISAEQENNEREEYNDGEG
jgi:hypothetical protein